MAASNTPTGQYHNPTTPNSEQDLACTLVPDQYMVKVHPGVDFVVHQQKVQRLLDSFDAPGGIRPDTPLAAMGIYRVTMPANVANILKADEDVKAMEQETYVPLE